MPILEGVAELEAILVYLWIDEGLLEDSDEAQEEFLAKFWRPQLEKRTLIDYRSDLKAAIGLFQAWKGNQFLLPPAWRPGPKQVWRYNR